MSEPADRVAPKVSGTRGRQSLWVVVGLAVVSALLMFVAFPPAEINALAWVGLLPLIIGLSQLRPAQGFLVGWLFGMLFMAGVNMFLSQFGVLPLAIMAIAFGLFYGLFGLVVAMLAPARSVPLRVLGIAAAWTLLEFARGHIGPFSYTFGHIGYTQHAMLPVLQLASIVGVHGVGFLTVLANAGLATLLLGFLPDGWYRPCGRAEFNRTAGRTMLAVYVLVFVIYVWGALVINTAPETSESAKGLRAAAVQANISLDIPARPGAAMDAVDAYVEMSEELPGDVDLIVWPESSVGFDLNMHPPTEQRISELARSCDAHMLMGALEWEGDEWYNSAYLVSPEGEYLGTYRKIDLVMYGEYVPMRGRWKWLERYPIRGKDFSPGKVRKLFDIGGLKVAPIICFEAIFPGPAREVTGLGADVIAILNSDAWAQRSAELMHNSYTAPLRAAEARRFVIRAASTGISAIYDPYGRPLSDVPTNAAGVAMAEVYGRQELSTYHKCGDVPLVCICLLGLLLAMIGAYRGSRPDMET